MRKVNKTQGFGVELEVSQARQGQRQGQGRRQGQRHGILRFMKVYANQTSLKWLTVAMPLLETSERLKRN